MSQHKNTAKAIFVVLDLTALAGMVGYVFVVFLGFWAGVAVGVVFWAGIGWPLLADFGAPDPQLGGARRGRRLQGAAGGSWETRTLKHRRGRIEPVVSAWLADVTDGPLGLPADSF